MNKLFHRVTAPGRSPLAAGSTARPLDRLLIRDLVLPAVVGIYSHEQSASQRIRINLDLSVAERETLFPESIRDVVSYEDIVVAVREIVAAAPVRLVETLAERIARRCLLDPRVRRVTVRLEKLDVFPDAAGGGIEIERSAP
jgi:dihydroneopterin aldolase